MLRSELPDRLEPLGHGEVEASQLHMHCVHGLRAQAHSQLPLVTPRRSLRHDVFTS